MSIFFRFGEKTRFGNFSNPIPTKTFSFFPKFPKLLNLFSRSVSDFFYANIGEKNLQKNVKKSKKTR